MALSDLLINPVTVQKRSGGTSMAGGTGALGSPVSYFASVQPLSVTETATQQRVGDIVTHVAYFSTDPDVRANDQINWNGKVLRVSGPAEDQAGRGVCFEVTCRLIQ
jgi:hypothetical protein